MKIVIAALLGIVTSVGGYFGYQALQSEPVVGGFSDPFISLQLAGSPQNGYILSTDGTNNSWIANTGGGGSGLFQYNSGTDTISPIIASTSNTARLDISWVNATSTASSSIFAGGFVSQASSTFTATTTHYDDLVMQHEKYIIAHGIRGDASDGFRIESTNGTLAAAFGTGGGATLTFPNYTSALLQTGSGGAVTEYAGTSCTNQFVRALSALGIATCESVDISDDTNLVAGTNITLTGDTLNVDDAFLVNDADDTTTGKLTIGGGFVSQASSTVVGTLQVTATATVGALIIDSIGAAGTSTLYFPTAQATIGSSTLETIDWYFDQTNKWVIASASGVVDMVVNGMDIVIDSTAQIIATVGGTDRIVAEAERTLFAFTVASTSEAFIGAGTIPISSQVHKARELTQYRCWVEGGTSVVMNVSDGTNDTETITCGTTVTSDTDVATNDTFTAGEKWYAEFGTVTGTVDYVTFEALGYVNE